MSLLLSQADVRLLISAHGLERIQAALEDILMSLRQVSADEVILSREQAVEIVTARLSERFRDKTQSSLKRVINASGVLLHTGLGRAPLSNSAREAILEAAGSCQLEVEPETGQRCYRGYQVAELLQLLTGAEASLVVNNNAGATLLVLQALCQGREVVISRGQLVEIGGSFRMPDIFRTAGVHLREVGTTNRTTLDDYASAITSNTAAILHVHASNYRVVGFTFSPALRELAALARESGVLLIDDPGSGQVRPATVLRSFAEPDFRDSLEAGADLAMGSGDKLLGGPQCGLILGRHTVIEQLRRHPLARCLRIDKLSLAALQATLTEHARNPLSPDLPLFQMLNATLAELRGRAQAICDALTDFRTRGWSISILETTAEVGGGSCAARPVPSIAVALSHPEVSASLLARTLRCGLPAVWPRTQENTVLLDLRSSDHHADAELTSAVSTALQSTPLAGL
jgi:L-seryl-tRNA(Ser) seleniumtransferase